MQVSESEINSLRDFVAFLNLQENSAVAVEGMRDVAALRCIGYRGTILEFHRFCGLAEFADAAAGYGTVIMLFDRDRKGMYLTRRLTGMLQRRTKVDTASRRRLGGITCGKIRCTEQLMCYLPHLQQ